MPSTEFAKIAVWSSLFSWGQFIISLSGPGFVAKATVMGGRDKGANSIVAILHYVFLAALACSLVWFLIVIPMNAFLAMYNEFFVFSCVLACLTAIQSSLSGYYRFLEQHNCANLIQVLFSMGTLISSYILAASGSLNLEHRVTVPAAVLLAIFFLYKPGLLPILRRFRILTLSEIYGFIRYSVEYFGHSVAHTIVGGLDRLVLSGHVNAVSLGNYHVIKQGAESVRIIGQAIQSQLAPHFLKYFHAKDHEKLKSVGRKFILYLTAGTIFAFFIPITLFIFSGRSVGLETIVVGLVLVIANSVYSTYDFKNLPWSLSKGFSLSARSVCICLLYASAIYAFSNRITPSGMSFLYLGFTSTLLLSTLAALNWRRSNEKKGK
ncbi:hypothetical protein [Chromobacterium violaceum]|uniref:hypothetical protein n=1 Tax=Chromobacterium violaceum TaxID=536 RepID=UPI003DA987B1